MNKLNAWFDDLHKLIQDSFICYDNLFEIYEKIDDSKILKEDFFIFLRYQQWFMLVIQLAKLFDFNPRTQKRNLISLCENITTNKFSDEIGNELKETHLIKKAIELKFKIDSHVGIISKVIRIRNKVYAHTDLERNSQFPTLIELKQLLDLSAEIYNNTRGQIFGIHTDFTKGLISIKMRDLVRILNRKVNL